MEVRCEQEASSFGDHSLSRYCFVPGSPQAEDSQKQKLDRQFQDAVANYDAGKYAEAAAQLEEILPHGANTFEVQELLGLVYASQSQEAKAVEHLKIAVRLKPDSSAARTNLATALLRTGKTGLAGEQFRKAVELDPKSFDTNRNLGQFYVQSGNIAEALPLWSGHNRSIQPRTTTATILRWLIS